MRAPQENRRILLLLFRVLTIEDDRREKKNYIYIYRYINIYIYKLKFKKKKKNPKKMKNNIIYLK